MARAHACTALLLLGLLAALEGECPAALHAPMPVRNVSAPQSSLYGKLRLNQHGIHLGLPLAPPLLPAGASSRNLLQQISTEADPQELASGQGWVGVESAAQGPPLQTPGLI